MITLHPQNFNTNSHKASFRCVIPVSYVVVDGHVVEDEKVVDDVTKQLVKQIKSGKQEDSHIRGALSSASKDESLQRTGHFVKKIGKYLITGSDAVGLKNIWSTNESKQTKAAKASNFIKNVFSRRSYEKLVVHAKSTMVRGKMRYIVSNLFTTIY